MFRLAIRSILRIITSLPSIAIAAGFIQEFEDETDLTRSHAEFVAVDRFSSARINVEAKSKHRRNVLGFNPSSTRTLRDRVGIKNLVLSAYKKQLGLPL